VSDARFTFHLPDGSDAAATAPLLCAGLIGWRSLKLAGDASRLGIYGFGSAGHIIAQVARFQGRSVYAVTRAGDEPAQQLALRLGAVWAGEARDVASHSLDAAIIFAPAGELVPEALRAVRKGGRVVCGGIHMSDGAVISLRAALGGTAAFVGRKSHARRRAGVLRNRTKSRYPNANGSLPIGAGKRRSGASS